MAGKDTATDRQSAFELDVIELAMLMHEASTTEFDLMEPARAHQARQIGLFMAANWHVAQFAPFIVTITINPVDVEGKSFPTGKVTIKVEDEELTLSTDEHGIVPSFTLRGSRWTPIWPVTDAKGK